MRRRNFMLAMAWFHMLFGAFFLFLNNVACNLLLAHPDATSELLVMGISGIVFSFGLMNYLARNSADSATLRAVLIGSAVYMAFTVAFDIHWTLIGMLNPIAWFSIGLRSLLVCGYVYHIIMHRTPAG